MSQGCSCKCPEHTKPVAERNWVVLQRYGNASAFNGYRWQHSDYSAVQCHACGFVWRTKASYVVLLKNGENMYHNPKANETLVRDVQVLEAGRPVPEEHR